MSELRALLDAVRALRAGEDEFLSATVVRVRGSGYRRAGARMLASREQWLAGSISGGCLERDIVTRGFWRVRSERALLVTYDDAEDALDERRGSGCQGVIDVLLERHGPGFDAGARTWFDVAERCLRDETRAASVTVFRSTRSDVAVGERLILEEGGRLTAGNAFLRAELQAEAERALAALSPAHTSHRVAAEGEVEVLVECITPPPHLFVFGSGHDVGPLITIAKSLGWTLSVWDALPRTATRERLSAADHYLTGDLEAVVQRLARCVKPVAVVMGHHFEQDTGALAKLLSSEARYIGVLGPRRRTDEMLAVIRELGGAVDGPARARVYAPVGLQLGAQTPAEIALAIVAEAQAALAEARVVALRDASGAIHARAVAPAPAPVADRQAGAELGAE